MGFKFQVIQEVEATFVKNQAQTKTCWSYATLSFLESELIRIGTGRFYLSEMFVVRKTYPRKAQRYVRLYGNMAFRSSSSAGDVLRVLREDGIVPEIEFPYREDIKDNHLEMDAAIKAVLDVIVSNPSGKLSKVWPEAVEGILNAYLGEPPKEFRYQRKTYTPKEFCARLGLSPDDYVQITSYLHHPFYKEFNLEVPDNWDLHPYLNLPLNEFMSVVDFALENGHSLVWDGDITERSFCPEKGLATLPMKNWNERSAEEKRSVCDRPEKEKVVTQQMRQDEFDNYTSTDDHLMHITGFAYDQNGIRFYKAKNSWGWQGKKHAGYIFISDSYFRSKTLSILVHKDAIPQALAAKN
ncbi:aminopeptidase [bacterium]|nr:aminopeptidase [bacterium]